MQSLYGVTGGTPFSLVSLYSGCGATEAPQPGLLTGFRSEGGEG
jgi:hypothetical protein